MKLVFKNRRMRLSTLGGALLLGLLVTSPGFAEGLNPPQPNPEQPSSLLTVQEFTKTIKKEFSITSTGSVDLSNKYGKIDVHTIK